jgi:hypothetical protein
MTPDVVDRYLVMVRPVLASSDVASGERYSNQAALPRRIRPSINYGGREAYNTTLCASGSRFRKYHDSIAVKK